MSPTRPKNGLGMVLCQLVEVRREIDAVASMGEDAIDDWTATQGEGGGHCADRLRLSYALACLELGRAIKALEAWHTWVTRYVDPHDPAETAKAARWVRMTIVEDLPKGATVEQRDALIHLMNVVDGVDDENAEVTRMLTEAQKEFEDMVAERGAS